MTKTSLSFLSILLIFLFFSCRTNRIAQTAPVYITNTKKYYLLPAQKIKIKKETLQLVSITYDKNKFTFQSYTSADKSAIIMDLMNEMGTSIGEISYVNGKAVCTSSFFPQHLKPEYILADFQFCYYDEKTLEKSLKEQNLDFSAVYNTEGTVQTRKILDGKNCIEQITITKNSVHLTNFLRGYEYILEDMK